MTKNTKINILIISVIAAITCAIFWQFFFKGLHPFPGNYMLAWYEPWKSNYTTGQTITIPHKPVADDTFRYLYPFKLLGIDNLKHLELPLWNPYNGSGTPLLATYQWGFFNPLNIFFLFLSQQTAWSIYIIMQAILLSLFTYIYCRKIKLSRVSSFFATITFLFSGFVIARLIFGNIIYPLATLPLILYLIEDYLENKRSKKIFLLPIAVAFMFLSGHPHPMIYVIIFSFSYFLYRVFSVNKIEAKISKTLFFIILFTIGAGIASIQTVPAIELLNHSNMNPQSSEFIFNRFLLPFSHLISIIIPNYYGNQAIYNYWGTGDYIETVASMGTISIFFAYFSLFNNVASKKKYQKFFLIASIVSIIVTLDWVIPKFLSTLPFPILSTSPPSRIFAITSFSIAILAGIGFDKWINLKKISKPLLYQITVFILLIAGLLIGTFILFKIGVTCDNQFIANCRLIALRNTILEITFFLPMIVIFFLYLIVKNKIVRYIPFLIIFLILILGLYNSSKFLPFSEKDTILKVHPLFTFLRTRSDIGRTFGLGDANLKTNFATHFRFFDPNYFDPLHNKRYAELISFANTKVFPPLLKRSDIEIVNDISIEKPLNDSRKTLFNILGVKYLVFKKNQLPKGNFKDKIFWEDKDWIVQENSNSLPRIYVVNDFEVISNPKSILERLFSTEFNYREKVILEKAPTFSGSSTGKVKNTEPEIIDYKSNSVLIKTNTTSDSMLVLSDNYYAGWKALVDGMETKIYRANYTFRAIELPVGKHIVEFSYKPESLKFGIVLSLVSIVLYILTVAYAQRLIKKND
jgi:hypothetical protein